MWCGCVMCDDLCDLMMVVMCDVCVGCVLGLCGV